MPENENQPEQPEHAEPAPEQATAEQTAGLSETEAAAQSQAPAPAAPSTAQQPGRFQRAARHRATPIVAAALAGVLVGGGVMSLIAFTGGDDEHDHDRVGWYRDYAGPERSDRHDGPGRFERPDSPRWFRSHPGDAPRVPELRERLRERPVPDHRHDDDGNVIPAPDSDQDERDGGN